MKIKTFVEEQNCPKLVVNLKYIGPLLNFVERYPFNTRNCYMNKSIDSFYSINELISVLVHTCLFKINTSRLHFQLRDDIIVVIRVYSTK